MTETRRWQALDRYKDRDGSPRTPGRIKGPTIERQ
jgi:hypothetical protein